MRTDGDTWDIVSSVGLTALGVATFRAIESLRPNALIEDPYAPWFVESAGEPHFSALLASPSSLDDLPFSGFMGMGMGIRTKFFDDFFLTAARSGVSQSTILASGLDARAYRLDWPTGTTVFEVDQPKVLEFKERVLTEHGAEPKADRRTVAVDLRDDWPTALKAAGFEPSTPSAWSAEGLLAYLPGPAHDALFERIDNLSSSGSRLALNYFPSGIDAQRFADIRAKYFSKDPFGDFDMAALFYEDERADPKQWLTEHDWSVECLNSIELANIYGEPIPDLPPELADLSEQSGYLTAIKTAS
ncbi:class I SAM-dependent methyltransferase [Rhodococcus sp. OK302]|uniref:class I SAM-dependent methyltransferase n=1 Tax=Rhodococcus sp. OK302 TaxID=1882769 RepID=UPI000B93F0CD|nr:class I SAM-dependent methyltransferase [Rhodococcus sp. OK302]OYD71889.1 methyltransferase (TIGR00027 family) [Rhodococcus sp. OK302]